MSAEIAPIPDQGESIPFVVPIGAVEVVFAQENAVVRTFDDEQFNHISFITPDGSFGLFRPESADLIQAMQQAGHVALHSSRPDGRIFGEIGPHQFTPTKKWLH